MDISSISPSRIKTFQACVFKYFLTYHTKEKLKSNWGAAHGSLIHDLLENYANDNDKKWMSRLYKGYAGELDTLDKFGKPTVMETPLVWAKPEDYADVRPKCDTCPFAQDGICKINKERLDDLTGCPKKLFESSIKMMETTLDRYSVLFDKNPDMIIGTEYNFRTRISGTKLTNYAAESWKKRDPKYLQGGLEVPMIGVMDLVIERDPETVEIIDYKTGKYAQSYDECLEDIQVRAYSWASRKEFIEDINNKGYNYKNIILTFDYFQERPKTVTFTEQEDIETEREIASVIKQIQDTTWITRVIGNGSFNWKCNGLCDTAVCEKVWKGKFQCPNK